MKFSYPSLLGVAIAFLTQAATPVHAVQRSLAGKIDWHKSLIGIPRQEFPPTFTKSITHTGSSKEEKDVLIAITEKNVLAVLEAKDGEVIWRQSLDPEDVILGYQKDETSIYTVSGLGGPIVRSFSLATGHLVWETVIGSGPQQLLEPITLGTDMYLVDDPAGLRFLAVLTGGNTVTMLDVVTGDCKWTRQEPSHGSTFAQIQMFQEESDTISILSEIQSYSSPQLGVSVLNVRTGEPTHGDTGIKPLNINLASPSDFLMTFERGSSWKDARYGLNWIDAKTGELKSVPKVSSKHVTTLGQGRYTAIKDIGLTEKGVFLAVTANGTVHVVKAGTGETLVVLQTISAEQAANAVWTDIKALKGLDTSTQVGTGKIYSMPNVDSEPFAAVEAVLTIDPAQSGHVLMASSNPLISSGSAIAVVTSTGSIQYWVNGILAWTREEGLSEIAHSVMVELPERKVEETIGAIDEEGFFARTVRHLQQVVYLPSYATSLVSRFTSGSYSKALSSTPLDKSNLFRDQFGFQQLVVLITSRGQLFALDSAHGNVVWQSLVNPSALSEAPEVIGMWNVRNSPEFGNPVIGVVAVKKDARTQSTVAYHIDAFSGTANETEVFSGAAVHAFPIPVEHCKTHVQSIAIVSPREEISFFPSCKKIKSGFANISSSTFFHLTQSSGARTTIQGFGVAHDRQNQIFKTFPTWSLPLGRGEQVRDTADVGKGIIASYGRVLGDRTTLYKYLNPHLVAYATTTTSNSAASVYVVDSTSGAIVYESHLDGIDTDAAVRLELTENWLVYSYAEKAISGKASRGHRLVSVELFEGLVPDVRTDSVSASTLVETPNVHAISRTFIVPVGVKRLQVTTSKYGITYKDLILVTDRNQFITIPRRMLDPRRPDVPSKRDKEEFLIPYQPLLFLDPKWQISHTYDVMNTKKILTSPSLLESTSIIVSHGLDLFGSRTTPSGTFDILSDYFNKTQLLLTILVLSIGISVARPAVNGKTLKTRWY